MSKFFTAMTASILLGTLTVYAAQYPIRLNRNISTRARMAAPT